MNFFLVAVVELHDHVAFIATRSWTEAVKENVLGARIEQTKQTTRRKRLPRRLPRRSYFLVLYVKIRNRVARIAELSWKLATRGNVLTARNQRYGNNVLHAGKRRKPQRTVEHSWIKETIAYVKIV
jgi:hypothetical protein